MNKEQLERNLGKLLTDEVFSGRLDDGTRQRIREELLAQVTTIRRPWSVRSIACAAALLLAASLLTGIALWSRQSIDSAETPITAPMDTRRLLNELEHGAFEAKLQAADRLAEIGSMEAVTKLEALSSQYYDHAPDNPFVRAAARLRTRLKTKPESPAQERDRNSFLPRFPNLRHVEV